MKTFLYLSVCWFFVGGSLLATAQDAPAAKPSMQERMLASLTPDEKAKYEAARDKVLEADPDLKKEQDANMAEAKDLFSSGDATQEEKRAFFEKMKAHNEKMKTAMLRQDSSLQPIFDKLEKSRAEAMAKRRAAQASGGGSGQ